MSINRVFLVAAFLLECQSFANPVHDAVTSRSLEQFFLALQGGADINGLDGDGQTPLDVALSMHSWTDIQSMDRTFLIIAELRSRGARTGDQVRAIARANAGPEEAQAPPMTGLQIFQAMGPPLQVGQRWSARRSAPPAQQPAPQAVVAAAPVRYGNGEIAEGERIDASDSEQPAAIPARRRPALAATQLSSSRNRFGPRPVVAEPLQTPPPGQNVGNILGVTHRARVGRGPETLITHAGTLLYVANVGTNDVDVISANTYAVMRTIPVGEGPRLLGLVNGLLYVANHRSNTVTVIDPIYDGLLTTFPIGEGPFAAAIVGEFLYVTIMYSDNVVVINTRTNRVEATIEVGRSPQWIRAVGGLVHVTTAAGELATIDTTTNQVVRRFALGFPEHDPFLDEDGLLFFENPHAPGLIVFNTRDNQVLETIPTGKGALVLLVRGTTVYVAARNSRDIHIFDWVTPNEPPRVIQLDAPAVGAVEHAGFLFVRHADATEITVVNVDPDNGLKFGQILATLPLDAPALEINFFGRMFYVALESGEVIFVGFAQLIPLLDREIARARNLAHDDHTVQAVALDLGLAARFFGGSHSQSL